MTIGLKQGSVVTEVGPGGILHSLCSTIATHLEGGRWGAQFPLIMGNLYQGLLHEKDVDAAQAELEKIKKGLEKLLPSQVVWDIENPEIKPAWLQEAGPHVSSMANFFVTTTGRDLLFEIADNLESLKEFGGALEIISYDGMPTV